MEVALVTDAPLNPYVHIEAVSPNFTAGAAKFDAVQTMKCSGLGILTGFISYGHPRLQIACHPLTSRSLPTFLDLFSFLRPVSSAFHVENSGSFPGLVM